MEVAFEVIVVVVAVVVVAADVIVDVVVVDVVVVAADVNVVEVTDRGDALEGGVLGCGTIWWIPEGRRIEDTED